MSKKGLIPLDSLSAGHSHWTRLPSQDPKRIHVAVLGGSSVGQSKALRINEFGSSAMEEPVDVHPRHSGWENGRSETCDADTSRSIYEDICLGEYENKTEAEMRGKTYNLEVPMDYI